MKKSIYFKTFILFWFCYIAAISVLASETGHDGTIYQLTLPKQGNMIDEANFYCWIPENVKTIRCILVHLHGCTREGDAKYMMDDLQWKALAKKWDAAFIAPSFNSGGNAGVCANWYNIENGSGNVFLAMLDTLARRTGHSEIKVVPWAFWGHSGGAIWITAMTGKYPERVAVAVAQSGYTDIADNNAALDVPILHHNGRQDILHNQDQVMKGRKAGALWAHAINPNTLSNMDGHQCHDMRLLAIPWLDVCLAARLPEPGKTELKKMDASSGWLGINSTKVIIAQKDFKGDKSETSWFPNKILAEKWAEYMEKGTITDSTPPPAPYNLNGVHTNGQVTLTWDTEPDLYSGIQTFIIYRNGSLIQTIRYTNVTKYSSTMGYQRWNDGDQPSPSPAPEMTFTDTDVNEHDTYIYEVCTVNWSNISSSKSQSFIIKGKQ
jgi:predicted esterase